jgi:hypothetical protein
MASTLSARAEAEDFELKKDLLEVFAITLNPSRNLVPECKPRGRGHFLRYLFRCPNRGEDSAFFDFGQLNHCPRLGCYTKVTNSAQGEL